MKISDFELRRVDGRARASARVTWEDSEREERRIFFETDDPRGVACNPHAFLLASAIPALRYGERRVYLEADLCPVLKQGLTTVASTLHSWYYGQTRDRLRIEARALMRGLASPGAQRAGLFFSGGVDSYASLRLNRQNFPAEHPYSIKDAILVFGLEQDDPRKFEHVREHLSDAARVCGISFLPLYTNIYLPYRKEDARQRFHFWEFEYQGSAFASIAHALVGYLSTVSVSATMSHGALSPYGSHPLIEPNLSTSDMKIRHTGLQLSRLAKTRLIAEWDAVLPYLRVCNQYTTYSQRALNCGECEKCIRTKLAFVALEKLEALAAFSNSEITADLIERRVRLSTEYRKACYDELLLPLTQRGRLDLVRPIKRKLAHYRRWGPADAHGTLRRLYRQALHKFAS